MGPGSIWFLCTAHLDMARKLHVKFEVSRPVRNSVMVQTKYLDAARLQTAGFPVTHPVPEDRIKKSSVYDKK